MEVYLQYVHRKTTKSCSRMVTIHIIRMTYTMYAMHTKCMSYYLMLYDILKCILPRLKFTKMIFIPNRLCSKCEQLSVTVCVGRVQPYMHPSQSILDIQKSQIKC